MEFSGSFKDLVGSKRHLGKVTLAIETAIQVSFATNEGTITQSEVKRRFELCQKIFKILRGDLKWGIERIIDHLPQYLTAELNGSDWDPGTQQRQCWIPSDGA